MLAKRSRTMITWLTMMKTAKMFPPVFPSWLLWPGRSRGGTIRPGLPIASLQSGGPSLSPVQVHDVLHEDWLVVPARHWTHTEIPTHCDDHHEFIHHTPMSAPCRFHHICWVILANTQHHIAW